MMNKPVISELMRPIKPFRVEVHLSIDMNLSIQTGKSR